MLIAYASWTMAASTMGVAAISHRLSDIRPTFQQFNNSTFLSIFAKIFCKSMILKLYPTNPNPRYVKMILECLADGGTIIFPTDTLYGLGGCINNPRTFERICLIKGIKKEKANFSFIFHDLSMLSEFTKPINNDVFKMMKRNLPGAFTFILEANNNIPRIFQSKKKTIGIRIPDQPIITNIVREFGSPIMTTSLADEEDEINPYLTDPEEIYDRYKDLVDIVIDGGAGENEESTVVDCTDNEIVIIRQGKGLLDE